MNATKVECRFDVSKRAHGRHHFMFDDEVGTIERELLKEMEALAGGQSLVIDFSDVAFSSEAARRLLKRALQRVQGEWSDRSVVLEGLGRGLYNVKVMLLSERLAAVVRADDSRADLVGEVEPAVRETYLFLSKRQSATAKDVQAQFDLNTIAAATNRLARLVKIGAARRIAQEVVDGGGLQYRYAAVK